MEKVSSMYLLREMVDATTTLVLQMAMWLAFTPSPLGLLTHTAGKLTMMNSVQARWLSHSATTGGHSQEHMTLGMPIIKW